jgi:16S rRNA (guanine527-N7)-methyltransferase
MPAMENFQELLLQSLGVELSPPQLDDFHAFEDLLLDWNGKFNLTSIIDPAEIHVKHFLDSLTVMRIIQNNGDLSLIDIGTGAGFPGIPLKIMLPGISLTLVESSQKKAEFCKVVVKALQLTNTSVIAARAEDLGKDSLYREKYDWAIARAVAELSVLAEYLLPFVKIGGKALAMKGANTDDEIQKAGHALSILGGELSEIVDLNLPNESGQRTLIVMKKIASTPTVYPRRAGMPSKKPIR